MVRYNLKPMNEETGTRLKRLLGKGDYNIDIRYMDTSFTLRSKSVNYIPTSFCNDTHKFWDDESNSGAAVDYFTQPDGCTSDYTKRDNSYSCEASCVRCNTARLVKLREDIGNVIHPDYLAMLDEVIENLEGQHDQRFFETDPQSRAEALARQDIECFGL